MIIKEEVYGLSGKMRVTFALPASIWADTIHLVGDFNDWNITATPLCLDDTTWSVTLDLDTNQIYHYRYLLDHNEWVIDWNTDGHSLADNGLNNSVVVTRIPFAKRGYQRNGHIR